MGDKFYAIKNGKKTGIFTTWDECKQYVIGYSGAEYKSFSNKKDAEDYLSNNRQEQIDITKNNITDKSKAIAYVDGSFNSETKEFSYGAVIFWNGKEYHFSDKYNDSKLAEMHNVAGELKGSEKAIEFAIEHKIDNLTIHHDYEGIAKWCTGEWKAKKEGSKAYKNFYENVKEQVNINFIKVKGHSGDIYNELADKLAKEATKKEDVIEIDKHKLEETVEDIVQNKTHSITISKEWCEKLISFMKSLENVSFNHTKHSKPKHDSYKFISSRDKITFNVYETGKFVIQGKPAYLYGEAISFLSYCPEITIDDILEANNELHNINVKISDIRSEMESIMPKAYSEIDETIIKILSPSLTLKKLQLELEDYSCYAFPALRALEGYLKYILDLKGISVGYKFGTIFAYNSKKGEYYLKKKLAKSLNDLKSEQALERIYNYFHKNRHTIFHADQILIQSRILEEKGEANLIINEVINIIETTYNDIMN